MNNHKHLIRKIGGNWQITKIFVHKINQLYSTKYTGTVLNVIVTTRYIEIFDGIKFRFIATSSKTLMTALNFFDQCGQF